MLIVRSETVRKKAWVVVSVAVIAAVAATGVFGGSIAQGAAARGAAAPKPTLSVAVLGGGSVTSKPAGIFCPRKCAATFAAGSRVLLTPKAKTGSRFLRWGGACTGAGACRVKVSALAAVAAQFVGSKTQPPPPPVQSALAEPGSYRGRHVGGYPVSLLRLSRRLGRVERLDPDRLHRLHAVGRIPDDRSPRDPEDGDQA